VLHAHPMRPSRRRAHPLVQEVVGRADGAAGNGLALVARGTGGACSRKFVRAVDGSNTLAARPAATYR